MVRDSLAHAFVPGAEIWAGPENFAIGSLPGFARGQRKGGRAIVSSRFIGPETPFADCGRIRRGSTTMRNW